MTGCAEQRLSHDDPHRVRHAVGRHVAALPDVPAVDPEGEGRSPGAL